MNILHCFNQSDLRCSWIYESGAEQVIGRSRTEILRGHRLRPIPDEIKTQRHLKRPAPKARIWSTGKTSAKGADILARKNQRQRRGYGRPEKPAPKARISSPEKTSAKAADIFARKNQRQRRGI